MTWAVPTWYALILLALAAYRVWRLLAHDLILDPLRHRLVRAESKQEEFLQCPWCLGTYCVIAWWLFWVATPHWSLVIATPCALAALVGLLATNDGTD